MEELRLKGEEEEGAGPSQHRPISEERPETARARTSLENRTPRTKQATPKSQTNKQKAKKKKSQEAVRVRSG